MYKQKDTLGDDENETGIEMSRTNNEMKATHASTPY
jgi:hypothetical protein